MLEGKPKRSFRALRGFVIIVLIYTVLAMIAAFFYPNGFSPLTNTLAQLGDSRSNPLGSIFYNVGVLLVSGSTVFIAALLLILPKQWLTPRGGSRRKLFYLSASFMVSFSFFFLLTALVPNWVNEALNGLFTLIFLVCLELFIVFSTLGVRRMKDHIRWLPAFGFTVAIANLMLVVASAVTGYSIFSWVLSVTTWSYMLAFVYQFS